MHAVIGVGSGMVFFIGLGDQVRALIGVGFGLVVRVGDQDDSSKAVV